MRWVAAAVLLAVTACGAPAQDGGGAPSGTVTVLAAASLADVVDELAADVERAHPGLTVVTSTGGSSALAAQVLAGAPADVLATASAEAMSRIDGADPQVFARNRVELVVPAGNPAGVRELADLGRPELAVALCAEAVPCGAAAAATLAAAGVTAAPDTLERDVRAVLTRVRLGEVDAGLVYRTDVLAAAGDVEGIAVPDGATTDYPITVLPQALNPLGARAFVDQVLSAEGRRVLDRAGFDAP